MNTNNYSEVYKWFEKSGIISNIRTHLRQNLVNALRSNIPTRETETDLRSAKQYVYDMLIAEYLLNYNYAYTLSVFTSEAPLLINLHQRTEVSACNTGNKSKHKLPNDYVCHTLETLGISPKQSDGQRILSQYATSNMPLILCILTSLVTYSANTLPEKGETERPCNHDANNGKAGNVGPIESLASIALEEAKAKLYQQKELFATQLKNKELELRQQALSIERQLISLNEKLEHAQNLMHLVVTQEKHLAQQKSKNERILASREKELSQKETLLCHETERLQKERENCRTFTEDMKRFQEELAKVRNEVAGEPTNLTKIKRDSCAQTDICDSVKTVGDLDLLNAENRELTSLIREQQYRIEELTSRAVTLSRLLEEAQLSNSPQINVVKKVNFNNIVSESSSTEDILQDAKMRLRRLEEESLTADQYFYNCITTSP